MEYQSDLSQDQLSSMFSSIDPMKRVVAARKAASYEETFATQLISLLDDEFYEARAYSAKSLGRIGHEPAIAKIILLLGDEVEEVRFSAAEALSYFTSDVVILPLLNTLSDHSRETRRQSFNALDRQNSSNLFEAMRSWVSELTGEDYKMLNEEAIHKIDVARGIMEACGHIDFNWIGQILKIGLHAPDEEMQRMAAISIGLKSLDGFRDDLLAKKDVEDDDVRMGMIYALCHISFDNKLSVLRSYVSDPFDFIREMISQELPLQFPDEDLTEEFNQLADDDFYLVRSMIASKLSQTRYLEILLKLAEDRSSVVRKAAIRSLGAFRDPKVLKFLESLEEEDELVIIAINEAMDKLKGN